MPSKEEEKSSLHPRNKNRKRYDLKALGLSTPELLEHIHTNKFGIASIDFSDPDAVKTLNQAILKYYYGIEFWDFPKENLCPPIPGRAEYIHHIADLLSEDNNNSIPRGKNIHCLDIGVGASCVYPIIGVIEYGWRFTGSDIDPKSIKNAQLIVDFNPTLKGKINCKVQPNPNYIFQAIISNKDKIDISICNPPFHASKDELVKGNRRKVKNLTGKNTPNFNFSGNSNELIYKGGEYQFIKNMIQESKAFAQSIYWFTTLVSKESNLDKIYKILAHQKPTDQRTIDIKTGHKTSRIVAWSYLTGKEKEEWRQERWKSK